MRWPVSFHQLRVSRILLVIPAIIVTMGGLALGIPLATSAPHPPNVPATMPPAVTSQQSALLYEAEQILIRQCMNQHGFQYWITPAPPGNQQFPDLLGNVAWARENGFGSYLIFNVADPNHNYLMALPSNRRNLYSTDLNGNGPDGPGVLVTLPQGGVLGRSIYGCVSATESKLYGNLREWFQSENVTNNLQYIWQAQVLNDPRYERLTKPWARCMKTRGYSYSSPSEASAGFLRPSGLATRELEIHTAVSSATCADSTGLTSTAQRLAVSYSNKVLDTYREEVITDRRLQLRAIPLAQRIVTSARHSS
jgi:hypothetical protein